MNNRKLPFFGKKGTIKEIKITATEKYIVVSRYGATADEQETILSTPNTKINYNLLMKEYMSNLKEYLNITNNKYETYIKSKNKIKLEKNQIYFLLSTGITMIALSIPLLITHDARGYFGIVLDTIAIPTELTGMKLYFESKSNHEKQKFIKEYENRKKELELLEKSFSKTIEKSETKFNGLENSKTEKIVDLNKCRVRKVA